MECNPTISKILKLESFKEEYLVKSNQVCARMEIEISDCQPTIAKNVL
jgi:hypothetical protein